jgi:hypothetical protein
MAAILFPSPFPPVDVAVQAVYNRVHWSDAWVSAGNLWCQRLALATGETISGAQFRWGFGMYLAPGGIAWTNVPVLAVNPRSFCRVDFTGTNGRASFRWYGVWQRAEKTDNVELLQAVGLEQLLEVPCLDLPYWDQVGSALRWAGRGLGFNVGGPNRGPKKEVNGQTVYVFSNDPLCTDSWSTRDAVETLLAAAAPVDVDDNVIFNWTPQNIAALPDFDKPEIPTHARSFLELLRSLVPRYRLIGWTVEPGSDNTVDVRFFTFAEGAITLTDADGATVGTIPANNTQDALVFTYDNSSSESLVTEASHVADQVIVRGDRRKIVCTLSIADGTLESKWTQEREDAYIAGASGALDYPPADEVRLREERDRDARNVDELRSVFAWFGPPTDWNQQSGDGEGNETKQPIALDDEDAQFWLHVPSLAIQPEVPREIDWERYDEDLPLLAFVRTRWAVVDPSGKDRWAMGDQVARVADLEQQDDDTARHWSVAVRPLAEVVASALWMEVRVQGSDQHAIAWVQFLGRDDAVVGAIPYATDIIVTVCLEDTRHLEARHPTDEDLVPLGDLVNRLYLDSPGMRYVDVRPNTVIGIQQTDQQLVRSAGEVVVDDTDELLLIAQRTYQWHAVPRYALGFQTGWIDAALQIGHLVTQLTDATSTYAVRSVISEITIDFPIAQSTTPQRPTLSITTAFAEMDAQRIV